MWTHEILQPEAPDDTAIEFERLSTAYADLDVMQLEDGKYYVEAVHSCDGETFIGHADSLEDGQQMAERWLLNEIAEMLKSLGAEGIWMVKGAKIAELVYYPPDGDDVPFSMRLQRPHERILLVRFPAGDGQEPGITYF